MSRTEYRLEKVKVASSFIYYLQFLSRETVVRRRFWLFGPKTTHTVSVWRHVPDDDQAIRTSLFECPTQVVFDRTLKGFSGEFKSVLRRAREFAERWPSIENYLDSLRAQKAPLERYISVTSGRP